MNRTWDDKGFKPENERLLFDSYLMLGPFCLRFKYKFSLLSIKQSLNIKVVLRIYFATSGIISSVSSLACELVWGCSEEHLH